MKKFQIFIFTLLAVSAFIVAVASTASAAETLLALWLANGNTFTTNLAVNAEGELLLEDNKVPIVGSTDIKCSGLFEGTVNGTNGESEITMLLSLGATQKLIEAGLVGEALLCTSEKGCEVNATDVEVWPAELPLLSVLFLEEPNLFLVLIFSAGAGAAVGYEMKCLVLGVVAEDTCKELRNDAEVEVANIAGGVETLGKAEPLLNCTQGGEASGFVESIAGNVENLLAGGPLAASE